MIQEIFWLDPLPPFRLDLTVWALRRKARNLIDQWDGTCYTRVLLLDGQPVKMTVSQPSTEKDARLLVTATSMTPLTHLPARISHVLERVLGYTIDVSAFANLADAISGSRRWPNGFWASSLPVSRHCLKPRSMLLPANRSVSMLVSCC